MLSEHCVTWGNSVCHGLGYVGAFVEWIFGDSLEVDSVVQCNFGFLLLSECDEPCGATFGGYGLGYVGAVVEWIFGVSFREHWIV